MARGTNTCSIEDNVMCGIPDFFYPIGYRGADPSCLGCVGHTYTEGKYKWGVSADTMKKRFDLSTNLNEPGGGIDVMTGYSRRVMETKPWLHYHREVALENLPDWRTFVAGINASPKARAEYLRKIRAKHPKNRYNSIPFYLTLYILIFLGVLWVFRFRKMKK
jgi:hypothetical protein